RIFGRDLFRHLQRHPLLGILNIVSIGLGVAVYLATVIANQSANRSFAASVEMVTGKADLQIAARTGDLPESLFPLVENAAGISAATPLVRGFVTLSDFPGEYLEVLGVDIFTNVPFRTFEVTDVRAGNFDLFRWLGTSDCIALTADFAAEHHLRQG